MVIAAGTLLLMCPWSTVAHVSPPFIDALFTATSAVCVTGLITVNTATYWSTAGKIVIMCLIEIGGLGIMTFATAQALVTGRRIGLKERMIIQEQTGQWSLAGLVNLMRSVIKTALAFELGGAIILTLAFGSNLGLSPMKAVFYGVFHSISAFCNAGFDIIGNSLVDFVGNVPVVLTVSTLIIAGGIGFHVIADVAHSRGKWNQLSLHSRIALRVTCYLLMLGSLALLVLEVHNPGTLGSLSPGERLLAAWFQSVTARTAGFNTVPQEKLLLPAVLVTIGLMFIGASPGGTGGGVKTTTFYTAIRFAISVVRQESDVTVEKRRLPQSVVTKAICIVLLSLSLVFAATFVLSVTEEAPFTDILFEVVSAFGTVGLSRGITPSLSVVGKVTIILTMFAGRVGPLSLVIALSNSAKGADIRYPEEKVTVG